MKSLRDCETPILFERMQRFRRWSRRTNLAVIIAFLVAVAGALIGNGAVVVCIMPVALALAVVFISCTVPYLRLSDEVHRRLRDVPWKIQRDAIRLYTDWMQAAIECNECHIPGDCPLCGAS
jgi:hypothetical protein